MDTSSSGLGSADRSAVEKALTSLLGLLSSGDSPSDTSGVCKGLVAVLSNHSDLAEKVAEVIAALGKEESFRDVAQSHSLVIHLTPLLASQSPTVQLQALRAIGNLCYDHDLNREHVLTSGGCPHLVNLLTKYCTVPAEEKYHRLKCVICGCVLNVSNGNEKVCKELLDLDVVRYLAVLLSQLGESEMAVQMGLQALFTLVNSESVSLEVLASTTLPSTLSSLLQRCNTGELEVTESVLEILGTLVDNDRWKISLVESGCVDHLLAITDEDVQPKVIDTIVLLLAEDSCLERLFEEGRVLERALEWVGSPKSSLERKASSALIVANMARSEATSVAIVKKGVVPLLIELTRVEEPEQMSGKIHHAALSALRNLSIPVVNKEMFLKEGVVDAALDALRQSSMAHVQFKALGILRLLADKQAEVCSHIISQQGSVSRVCEVCANVGPVHVQIEGSRLLAAIVKHCKDPVVMQAVVGDGGVRWVMYLLEAEHDLLRNEGLIALNLLAAQQQQEVRSSLVECSLVPSLAKLLNSTDISPENTSNALVLVESCSKSDTLRAEFEASSEMKTVLHSLCGHSDDTVKAKAIKLCEQLYPST